MSMEWYVGDDKFERVKESVCGVRIRYRRVTVKGKGRLISVCCEIAV